MKIIKKFYPLLSLLIVAGCSTSSSYNSSRRNTILPAPSAGAQTFSDESSRAIVKQTRKLLALKEKDYLVGADDVLEISIFEWELTDETRTLELRVSKTGLIAVPALGAVQVKDKTVEEIQALIVEQLEGRRVLQNPRVGVTVKEYRSRRISVTGAALAPGVYALQENVATLIDVISLAGGVSGDAGALVYVLRAQDANLEPIPIVIELDKLFKTGRSDLNAILQDGDVVYIPPAPLVYIYGSVQQPGGVSLNAPTSLLEALSLAGGFAPRANKNLVSLSRSLEGGDERIISVNVARIERGESPDMYLQEGDVIRVSNAPEKTFFYGLWNAISSIVTVGWRLNPDD